MIVDFPALGHGGNPIHPKRCEQCLHILCVIYLLTSLNLANNVTVQMSYDEFKSQLNDITRDLPFYRWIQVIVLNG